MVYIRGHAVAQLVEALCKSRKVASSISDEVIGYFKWPNPQGHLWGDCLQNVEASTSHYSMGLHGLLQG
jgi:hypothetical protein